MMSGAVQAETTPQDCFLCIHDTRPCEVKQLEGLIVGVRQLPKDSELFPYITLDIGESLASVRLMPSYNGLAKQLLDTNANVRNLKLRLRILHLPQSNGETEYKGQTLTRYMANELTLAVLEPDTILNITDLNSAEYCARQYLLNRLIAMPQSAAAARGNLVHASFKELLKEYDRGELMQGHIANGEETPLATLQRHFELALEHLSSDLAISNIPTESIRADVASHLESLASWFEQQHASLWDLPDRPSQPADRDAGDGAVDLSDASLAPTVRAETFLLAPEIGLRGRLDLLWRQRSRQRLLELKTGGSNSDLPKSAHRRQVEGYLALLAVRRDPKMKNAQATLLYSSTPGEATDFSMRFTIKQLQRVIESRNTLVLSHVTGTPAPPPGPSRCTKCSMRDACTQISSLLDWQPPQAEEDSRDLNGSAGERHIGAINGVPAEQDRAFFAKYYELLRLEGQEIERQQALLWTTSMQARIESGMAIGYLTPSGDVVSNGQGEWEQIFACKNTSELREGDEILLSDGNPITGEVVSGTILEISSESVKVWMRERINHPTLIDKYATDIVNVRTQQNLLRWLSTESRLRLLVAGARRPRFSPGAAPALAGLNEEQRLAVERALQMQDYLLIHGPPGTGKTSVIAAIVCQLCARGQRVLLAAFTNQAVDNMLQRLEREGFHDFVRLGHDRSVNEHMQPYLLKQLVSAQDTQTSVQSLLRETPVIASTTATWSSDKYTPSRHTEMAEQDGASTDSPLRFDVAIIDEAGQLTVPAILGALRFAKRFILVGDEKQLPPLVMSEKAAGAGLKDSLFSFLKQLDYDYTKSHPREDSACVSLKVQYRMNTPISQFASDIFYGGALRAHETVAGRVLEFASHYVQQHEYGDEAWAITQALDPHLPLVFLDVQDANDAQDGPKTSSAEAREARTLVAGLLARGINEKDIGIIAPYKAQVANIRRHLFGSHDASGWKGLSTSSPLTVDTVDRFQGGERSILILSFATTTTPPAGSQLRKHLTDPNRLNVALTRAQRKLILVGHAHALSRLPIFDRLLAYCRDNKALILQANINGH
jgi:DNA replication ATP-dependent helicase Dna2